MKYLFLMATCLFTLLANAQDLEDSVATAEPVKELPVIDKRGSKYLDDGIRHGSKDELLWSPFSLISGYMEAHYTRKLSRSLTLDFAGMVKMYTGLSPLESAANLEFIKQDSTWKSGYGYGVSLRFNPYRRAMMEYAGYGFSYRNRTVNYEKEKLMQHTVGLVKAKKRILPNNFGYELVHTVGLHLFHTTYQNSRSDPYWDGWGFYSFEFRIGYYF